MFGCWRWAAIWVCLALLVPVWAAEDTAKAVLRQPGDPGERLYLVGRVVDGSGRALAGAMLNLWHADGTGTYRQDRFRTRLETGGDGAFYIDTILPGQDWGTRHIHLVVSHERYPDLETRIVFKGDADPDRTRASDIVTVLEEARENGDRVLVGDVEVVLGASPGN